MANDLIPLIIDINKEHGGNPLFSIVQSDHRSRTLEVSFRDFGNPDEQSVSLVSHRVTMWGEKPDGTYFFFSGSISDPESGTALFELPAQASAAVGMVRCEFTMWSADGRILTTRSFVYEVLPRLRAGDRPESESELSVMDELVTQVAHCAGHTEDGTVHVTPQDKLRWDDALTGDADTLEGRRGEYYLDYANLKNKPEMPQTYVHPDTPGCMHVPAGGAQGQFLGWGGVSGAAVWSSLPQEGLARLEFLYTAANVSNPAQLNGHRYYDPVTKTLRDRDESGAETTAEYPSPDTIYIARDTGIAYYCAPQPQDGLIPLIGSAVSYDTLIGRPQIGSVTLSGSKTAAQLGLAPAGKLCRLYCAQSGSGYQDTLKHTVCFSLWHGDDDGFDPQPEAGTITISRGGLYLVSAGVQCYTQTAPIIRADIAVEVDSVSCWVMDSVSSGDCKAFAAGTALLRFSAGDVVSMTVQAYPAESQYFVQSGSGELTLYRIGD